MYSQPTTPNWVWASHTYHGIHTRVQSTNYTKLGLGVAHLPRNRSRVQSTNYTKLGLGIAHLPRNTYTGTVNQLHQTGSGRRTPTTEHIHGYSQPTTPNWVWASHTYHGTHTRVQSTNYTKLGLGIAHLPWNRSRVQSTNYTKLGLGIAHLPRNTYTGTVNQLHQTGSGHRTPNTERIHGYSQPTTPNWVWASHTYHGTHTRVQSTNYTKLGLGIAHLTQNAYTGTVNQLHQTGSGHRTPNTERIHGYSQPTTPNWVWASHTYHGTHTRVQSTNYTKLGLGIAHLTQNAYTGTVNQLHQTGSGRRTPTTE